MASLQAKNVQMRIFLYRWWKTLYPGAKIKNGMVTRSLLLSQVQRGGECFVEASGDLVRDTTPRRGETRESGRKMEERGREKKKK